MIIGIGIDVVPVDRFAESLTRTPGLRDRLFTAAEQTTPTGYPRTGESLAARFAAKEAARKALGTCLGWRDVEVRSIDGAPRLWIRGEPSPAAVSLSHDGGVAIAVVVAPEEG